jgi:transcriptional regulator with XRE-family HTH domain
MGASEQAARARAVQAEVGRRLRDVRTARGLSIPQAAELSGFTRGALGSWERGTRAISVAVLHRLATAYGVLAGELIPRSDAGTSAEDPVAALAVLRRYVERVEHVAQTDPAGAS